MTTHSLQPSTVTFWGAARTVTGSMHVLRCAGKHVLLDCGLYQGKRAESWERNSTFPFAAREIDAVILSHAHIDHCGNLPNLVRQGFHGPIYCTPATRDLMAIMLADSAKIQEEDTQYLKRKHRDEPPHEPLYDLRDVQRTLQLAHSIPYEKAFDVLPGLQARFVEAGHLLGSAMVAVQFQTGSRSFSLTFTGDHGRKGLPILRDPAPVPACDFLISESTYGGKRHPSPEFLVDALGALVSRTVQRGGKVIIPAFSLGRTQTVVFYLHQLMLAGKLAEFPIYVDSPLAANATQIFRLHPECFDDETAQLVQRDADVFGQQRVRYLLSVEDSKRLNDFTGPCIIIAASGMCETGRVLHHLKNNIEDARTTILLVGYQAPETLGRRLAEHKPEVRILSRFYKVRAEVVTMHGFSSHADHEEMLAALAPLAGHARRVCLVHGEPESSAALAAALQERGFALVDIPDRGQTIAIE
jgi:metallo-beta-lactamase family protein